MKTNKPNKRNQRENAWMKVIEFAVVSLATWLNPNAGIAIFGIKLCFQVLKVLRDHHRNDKDDEE